MSLDFQFANLLSANALKSVEWSEGPIILVIDALDECGSKRDRKILMQALSKGFSGFIHSFEWWLAGGNMTFSTHLNPIFICAHIL